MAKQTESALRVLCPVPEQSAEEKLREIRELLNKATPGPWKVDVSENFGNDWPITTGTFSEDGKCYHVCTDGLHASELTSGDAKADAELICALRNNAASLLDAYALGLRHMRERAAKLADNNPRKLPRCGYPIYDRSNWPTYGCCRAPNHDGPHETLEDRRQRTYTNEVPSTVAAAIRNLPVGGEEMNEEWVISRHGDWFSGEFYPSKAVAIEAAPRELQLRRGATFYVGRVEHIGKPETMVDDIVETLINEMWDRYRDMLRDMAGPDAPDNDQAEPGISEDAARQIAEILTRETPTPTVYAVRDVDTLLCRPRP